MTAEELRALLRRKPFMPFRLHISDQAAYDIRNPEMVMIGRTIVCIGIARDVDSPFFDEPAWVALHHITRVEPIVEPQPAA